MKGLGLEARLIYGLLLLLLTDLKISNMAATVRKIIRLQNP